MSSTSSVASSQPGSAEVGIDAALEAIAGVRHDAELAAGLGDVGRVPQRALDQHVAGRLVAARMLAAHDAGDQFDAACVGDDDHALVERVGLAVERQHALARARAAHRQVALDLGEVEHVQRAAAVEGHVVGDVDQRADRPEPDGAQALLHPFRRRPVRDAAHQAQREGGAEMRVGRREIETHLGRAIEGAVDRLRRRRLEGSEARRGEIARDAGDAGRVGAVRRQGDVDDRIVEPGEARVGDADRRVVRQLHDALVIVAELELGRRAQHAVRLDAADDALGEGDLLPGDVGPDRREHALHAGARVGRAAHDLHGLAAGVDHADPQPVGVGMLFGLDDARDDEAVVFGARVLDAFDLEADAGQRIDDLGERGRRVEMVLEPGEGEFHRMVFSGSRDKVDSWSFVAVQLSRAFERSTRTRPTSRTATQRETLSALYDRGSGCGSGCSPPIPRALQFRNAIADSSDAAVRS